MTREEKILKFLPYVEKISDSMCFNRRIADLSVYDDCRSDAAVAMIKAIDNYNPKKSASLKTWVTIKVRGELKDFFRNWAKKPKFIMCEYIDDIGNDGLEDKVCDRDLIEKIFKYLNSKRKRIVGRPSVLWGYYAEGKTGKEIAEERGCSETNIWIIISGAKNDIKNSELFKNVT